MSRARDSLRTRLMLSHVLVVFVGVITVLIATAVLAPTFIGDHIDFMDSVVGPELGEQASADFESGILQGLGRAVFAAAVVSTIAALVVGIVASNRLIRPIDRIRSATRRLASGAYSERVEPPHEAELAALADDVNMLASELEQTEIRRLRLIAEVAHELRTPLATIHGYMEGLTDGVFEPSNEIYLAVSRETSRLERLATDLAELSAVEEGSFPIRPEDHDLSDDVGTVTERLQPHFAAKRVDLVVADLPSMPVRGDRDRITQILTNVIGNALSHTPEGGTVTVAGAADAATVQLSVTDTGRGLTKEQMNAVFDRFYRADRSAPGGAGIGLTIARSLARAHRGDLDVTSPGLGHGATFTLTVPTVRTTAT
ncbi:MAG: ATP-binding protein [Actinomycetota bacterium]